MNLNSSSPWPTYPFPFSFFIPSISYRKGIACMGDFYLEMPLHRSGSPEDTHFRRSKGKEPVSKNRPKVTQSFPEVKRHVVVRDNGPLPKERGTTLAPSTAQEACFTIIMEVL